jgi:hypothetical protein
LGLKAVLTERIREIHETIGEDAAILDKNEQLNEAAMYAIYEGNKIAEVEDQEEEFMDLNEAEEFFRTLAKQVLFSRTDDEEVKAQINILEKAFGLAPTSAVAKELNALRRNGVVGEHLLKTLANAYHQHRLQDRLDHVPLRVEKDDIPRIICSEAL